MTIVANRLQQRLKWLGSVCNVHGLLGFLTFLSLLCNRKGVMRAAACIIASFALLVGADTNYTVDDFQRDRIEYVPNVAWRAVSVSGDHLGNPKNFLG